VKIGSHLAKSEAKVGWHLFLDTVYIVSHCFFSSYLS